MSRRYGAPFWTSVHFGPSCWEWMASRQAFGHGTKWIGGSVRLAHRIAWESENGSIPDGLCVCHRCDNPRCVRPDHLFLGTRADNTADMDRKGRRIPANRGKTHCKRGHQFTPENTYVSGHGKRACRSCKNASWRAFYARKVVGRDQTQRQ